MLKELKERRKKYIMANKGKRKEGRQRFGKVGEAKTRPANINVKDCSGIIGTDSQRCIRYSLQRSDQDTKIRTSTDPGMILVIMEMQFLIIDIKLACVDL
jgi:hypothetical protein